MVLTLTEGGGDCGRGGGHGGSGWRGNHSRVRNRRQNESVPKWHFSILSIPRELFGLSIIGTYGKIEVAEIVDLAQKGSVKSAGNNNARRSCSTVPVFGRAGLAPPRAADRPAQATVGRLRSGGQRDDTRDQGRDRTDPPRVTPRLHVAPP